MLPNLLSTNQEASKKMFYNWLLQTCVFFEKIHGMCKDHYNVRLSLFIFALAHRHAALPFSILYPMF
jgi:hypothetical protein